MTTTDRPRGFVAIRPWYAPKNPSLEDICMSEVNTKELHPEIWKLFDQYVHGLIDRRGFLDGAAKYTAGSMTAVGILEALRPNYAEAQIQVAPTDSRIKTEKVEIKSPERQRHDSRAAGAASGRNRPASGCRRHPREPRPQPAHRGRRPTRRGRRIHGDRARRVDLAGRLSRHRRSGRRNAAEARTAEDDGRFHCDRSAM